MEAPSHVMLQYGGEDWGPLLVRCWWLVLEAGEHKGWRVTRTTNTLGSQGARTCTSYLRAQMSVPCYYNTLANHHGQTDNYRDRQL